MNEAETRAELIDPALREAGWGIVEGSQIRREYRITLGRLQGGGRRAKPDIADYVLVYKGRKLAVVEAKPRDAAITEGLGQAKQYADKLAVRMAISTNGRGIYQADMESGAEGDIARYPTPDELWNTCLSFMATPAAGLWRDRFAAVPFEDNGGLWQSRYYQDIAVDRVTDAIADNQKRVLLTLATGTGKTSVAFQIAWKLFQSRWNLSGEPTRRPRILFLADRNILADQAFNAFNAFPEDALVRIDPEVIKKNGRVPKNGSIFFTIFQTFMSGKDKDGNSTPSFGDYPSDFFDFVIVDECHRGGAQDESTWRAILDYFSPAVQLGLTATPKRRHNADTYRYFGEPVYSYSLKDGINDGYLTPFKVRQIATTLDDYVYTADDQIIDGEVQDGKRYSESDFNRIIEIKQREEYRVRLFMQEINQREKSIVFCATQDHALAVRDLINQMKTVSKDPFYCVRVTADEGATGERYLREFQDNEKSIPTILTTSVKLSTGVDARNVRNIVLMRPINSMIEFKQIIGRGTRLFDGKDYFTIYDFVRAYEHFNDPEWDGEPLEPTAPTPRPPRPGGDDDGDGNPDPDGGDDDNPPPRPAKLKIKLADGKERTIQSMMSTSYWSPDGRPISAAQFIEGLFGELPAFFKNEDELRALWSDPTTRKTLLDQLSEKGYGAEQLDAIKQMIDAEKSDLYDVLAYIAFALAPVTREERVTVRKSKIMASYDEKLQAFLGFVLGEYVKEGVGELDQSQLPHLLELKYRAIDNATKELGTVAAIRDAFVGFQKYLYERA